MKGINVVSENAAPMHGAGPTDREQVLEVGAREIKAWARRRVQDCRPIEAQQLVDILEVYFPEARPI